MNEIKTIIEICNEMEIIYNHAIDYRENLTIYDYENVWECNKLVLGYYRDNYYNGPLWDNVGGIVDDSFIAYLSAVGVEPYDGYTFVDPSSGKELDFKHQIAALSSHMAHMEPDEGKSNLGDFGGWSGDLVSLIAYYYASVGNEYSPSDFMQEYCFSESGSMFGDKDYLADIDGYNIYQNLFNNQELKVYTAFENYYESEYNKRHVTFFENRFDSNDETMELLAANAIKCEGNGVFVNEFYEGLFFLEFIKELFDDDYGSLKMKFDDEADEFAKLFVKRHHEYFAE